MKVFKREKLIQICSNEIFSTKVNFFQDLRMFEAHISDIETVNARTIAQLEVRVDFFFTLYYILAVITFQLIVLYFSNTS